MLWHTSERIDSAINLNNIEFCDCFFFPVKLGFYMIAFGLFAACSLRRNQLCRMRTMPGLMVPAVIKCEGGVWFSLPNEGVFGVLGVFGVFRVTFACERFSFNGVRSPEPLFEWFTFSFKSEITDSFSLLAFCNWIIFWKINQTRKESN